MRRKHSILLWLPACIVLLLIFIFSSDKGLQSHNLSIRLVRWILNGMEFISDASINVSGETMWKLDFAVRKIMHITEYAFLTVTIMFPLYLKHIRDIRLWLLCMGICFLYACFDEMHQYFVEDRYGRFADVLIDCIGVLIGILIFYLMVIVIKAVRERKKLS